jgi:uncharacterized membrane protein YkoI
MRLLTTLSLLTALSCAAGTLVAQDAPGMKRDVPDSLVAKAKVNEDSARAVALKRVPGTVESIALAKMRTRLVYTFEIQRSGRKGLTKVEVNAATGHVIAVAAEGTRARTATRRSS